MLSKNTIRSSRSLIAAEANAVSAGLVRSGRVPIRCRRFGLHAL